MVILTKTRVDIADRHTSLYFLNQDPAISDPLGIGSASKYRGLYEKVIQARRLEYSSITGKTGTLLNKLTGEDPDNPLKYWIWYLGAAPAADDAWKEAIPLLATLNHRLEISPPDSFPAAAKVSPIPQVILYPFGWSTWISLLITGQHTLQDLVALVTHVSQQNAVKLLTSGNSFTLRMYFDFVAKGIRSDVFGGSAMDRTEVNTALVITALEKSGGSPFLDGLGEEGKKQLRSLVRPLGPISNEPFEELVVHLVPQGDPDREVNYLIADQLGRFIWIEELLKPENANQMKLECYHHNSFRALIQAWHFYGLVKHSFQDGLFRRWNRLRRQPGKRKHVQDELDSLSDLMTTAFRRLEDFGYHNASLRKFLDNNQVKNQIRASHEDAAALGVLSPQSNGEDDQPSNNTR